MAPVHALDPYYLGITILVTIGYQLSGFAIAWILQFDKITDFTGGSNFFILALLTLLIGNTFDVRNIVASVLVMIWATRLAGFLLFRVLKTGSDTRFDDIRAHFFKFLGFWIGQILWVWTVSLPLTVINSPSVSDGRNGGSNPTFGTSRDIAGIILWVLGWVIESTADIQKYRYKSSGAPKDRPIQIGVWKYSRHPPYFGEIMCWWGIWILCLSPSTNGHISPSAKAAQYGSIVSPIFTTILLMFGSGVPTAEKPQAKKFYLMSYGMHSEDEHSNAWRQYKAYLKRTSILIPLPPSLYTHIPEIFKKTLLLDFPIYRFDEEKDGSSAREEDRKRIEDA